MKVVARGLGGFIGSPLKEEFSKKYEVLSLARNVTPDDAAAQVDGAYAVINLAGEPIAGKRWSKTQKKELITSRLNTTRLLVEAMSKARNKPKVFLNASAIGFYGPRDTSPVSENTSAGSGFLADVCREWERQALKAESFGVRVALLRTGIVLGTNGGALGKMLLPFQLGLGGPLGSGKQIMSWIHLEDEVSAILYCLENENIHGPVNLTAPNPVSMAEFTKTLGRVLKRPAILPVPALALKVLLGEMSTMLLEGQNVQPEVLAANRFQFKFKRLEDALKDLL